MMKLPPQILLTEANSRQTTVFKGTIQFIVRVKVYFDFLMRIFATYLKKHFVLIKYHYNASK